MKVIQGKLEGVELDKAGGVDTEHTVNFLPGILKRSYDLVATIDSAPVQ